MQPLTVISRDKKGGGGEPESPGGDVNGFYDVLVYAHLAIVLDPRLDFTYAIFYSLIFPL